MTTLALPHELDDGVDGGAQLQEIVPRLGALVAKVRPGDLALSTPCAGWTTRDLLNHVVGGASMFAEAFCGAPVRDISGRLPDVIGDDPLAAFQEAGGRFGAATQQPGAMERVIPLPWGAMTGQTFLRFVAFDLLVHSWDLATTLEAELDVPDPLVAEIEHFARRVLDSWERDDVNFRAAMPADAGSSAIDGLAAYTGRVSRSR